MAGSSYRPKQCHVCKTPACQGDCQKCPKRLAGKCTEVYGGFTERAGNKIIWRAICRKCENKVSKVLDKPLVEG